MMKGITIGVICLLLLCGCNSFGEQSSSKSNQAEINIQVHRMEQIKRTDHWDKMTRLEGIRTVEPMAMGFRKGNRIQTASNESIKSGKKSKRKNKKIDRQFFESLGVVWDVPVRQKVIALTFDDGPNPKYTPEILKSLEQYHAKATFFVSGKFAEYYPNLVKREALEGHEVANHTYSHPRIWKLSNEQIKKEINLTQRAIITATGKKPTLFRPIGGYISERIVKVAKDLGYTVILWSWHQDSQDWRRPGISKIVNKVVENAHGGDIVLLHDNGRDRSQTVQALKQILPELQHKGYKFVTVSELLQMKTK